jgi:hypothetical protein
MHQESLKLIELISCKSVRQIPVGREMHIEAAILQGSATRQANMIWHRLVFTTMAHKEWSWPMLGDTQQVSRDPR